MSLGELRVWGHWHRGRFAGPDRYHHGRGSLGGDEQDIPNFEIRTGNALGYRASDSGLRAMPRGGNPHENLGLDHSPPTAQPVFTDIHCISCLKSTTAPRLEASLALARMAVAQESEPSWPRLTSSAITKEYSRADLLLAVEAQRRTNEPACLDHPVRRRRAHSENLRSWWGTTSADSGRSNAYLLMELPHEHVADGGPLFMSCSVEAHQHSVASPERNQHLLKESGSPAAWCNRDALIK